MSRYVELIALPLVLVAAMLLPGCGGDSGGPSEPTDPVCDLDVQSLAFGSVTVGESLDLAFEITNTGGGTLAGTVSEACADFSIVGDADYSLGAGDTAAITVRFAPASAGAVACTLDTGASQCPGLPCSGTGVAVTPVCQVSPVSLDFGTVIVGSYYDRTFTVTNVGGGTLSGSVSESSGDYDIASGSGAYSLTASQSVTVTVRFSPASVGTNTCTIETGGSCQGVACTGVGDLEPACDLSATELDFGTVFVGDYKDTTLTITNIGGGLLIGELYADCEDFSVVGGSEFAIGAGQAATFTMRFTPASAGPGGCSIDMDSDFCDEVTCTGVGELPPACEVYPESLDFGDIEVGESADLTFYVRNAGGPSFSGTVSSPSSDFTIVGDASYDLDSGELKEFTLRFAPVSAGAKACTLDTGAAKCAELPCGGTGVVYTPVCQVSQTSLGFDVVFTGSYLDETFTITNIGDGTLSGSVSESSDDFSIISGGGDYSLAASESVVVTVRFAPTSEGNKTCTIETGALCTGVWCTGDGALEPICDLNVSSLDFGTVMIGAEKDTTFTITNTGGWWLTGEVSPGCGDFWVIADMGGYYLGAGESITFTVRYAPSSEGPAECTIYLDSDYCEDIPCTGTGALGPICDVYPDTLDFGFLMIGGNTDLTFTLRNTVGGTMSGTVSSPCPEFSIVGNPAYSLSQGDSATFTVRFAPASLGTKVCTIETGSGTCVDVAARGGGAPDGNYFVHASSGSDTNPGTVRAPFKTITHAVYMVGPNQSICVLPGLYDAANGEVFPIHLQQGQYLMGDVLNKGVGPETTAIYGSGDADPTPGNDFLAVLLAADQCEVAGLTIGAPYSSTFGVYYDDAIVDVHDNTFGSAETYLYGGVYIAGTGGSTIMLNDFLTSSYGVYSVASTGGAVVRDNLFQSMAIPIDIRQGSNMTIRDNMIVGSGQNGIQVASGAPVIRDNTFNKPGGYSTYGAIRCGSSSATPKLRGNTFVCSRGMLIDAPAIPDLGSNSDLGGNDFSGVTGAAIHHTGSTSVNAVGNTWANSPPVCGTDIVTTGSSAVVWGEAGESCP
jgi:hypothetical protein